MPSMTLSRDDVIVGVDTHKDQHVAVLLDGLGGRLADLVIPATATGYAKLLAFCLEILQSPGRLVAFGVEGTGSYGRGLAGFLRKRGYEVREVSRPPRSGVRRHAGKSDTIDAEHAARQVAAGVVTAIPKTADGAVEALRLLKAARDTAVKAQSATMITLKATLVTADDELRGALEPLTDHRLIEACAALECVGAPTTPTKAMLHVLASLARRWLSLHDEVKSLGWHLKQQTKTAAPRLVEAVGIGPDTAAEMLLAAGDNNDRIRSESAFAKLCGVSPIPASSGKTHRHRLNRGGNRQANAALYRTVIVRMRWHQPTIDYVDRRTAEGLTKREIIRCLKRYVAREVYRLLPPPSAPENIDAATAVLPPQAA
ncbi:transposase [Parafrankia colletiae]|uniref:Transposase n=1 Tax=Parafrankia colletiae TaxID=573497 RepID=A0A1S1RFR1_9ACTN|nr:transposase [Parafrankia colletiae]